MLAKILLQMLPHRQHKVKGAIIIWPPKTIKNHLWIESKKKLNILMQFWHMTSMTTFEFELLKCTSDFITQHFIVNNFELLFNWNHWKSKNHNHMLNRNFCEHLKGQTFSKPFVILFKILLMY